MFPLAGQSAALYAVSRVQNHLLQTRFTRIAGISNLAHQCKRPTETPNKWDTATPL